jgi:regulator of cell morphogenesis and NO signaling
MKELTSLSLAQIVNNNHQAASVFEKYHLDFCCKGKRTLKEACEESNLELNTIITDLENISGARGKDELEFTSFSLAQLVEYIVETHHSYVKKEMPALLGYLQKIASKHGERHPELLRIFEIFEAIKEEMELHMKKEELILFPRIKEMEKLVNEKKEIQVNHTYLQSPVTIMEQEHDHAGRMLEEIRELTHNYEPPADACTTYRLSYAALQAFELDLHRHVHIENNILFPKALQLFGMPNTYSLN